MVKVGANLTTPNIGDATFQSLSATGGTGNIIAGNINLTHSISVAGNVFAQNISATGTLTFATLTGTTVSASGNVISGNVNTGNIAAGNISTTGNVTVNYIIGDGSALTSITGANVTGTVANATYALSAGSAVGTAATVTTNAQPNITSVGTLTTLSVTGNIDSGNIVTGNVTATGNVQGTYLLGNGAFISGLPAGYANADVANYLASGTDTLDIITTGNIIGGNISTSGNIISGNIVTAGTGGNISGANYILANVVSASGNVTGSYILGNGAFLTGLPAGYANSDAAAYFASGTSSSNISITGNLLTTSYVSATGNVTGNYILGNGALLTGVITSVANINNGTSNVTVTASGGNITVGVSGVGNVATFTPAGLSVTGAITATGNIVGGGVRTTTGSSAPTSPAPAVGDMWFNTNNNITYRYTYDGASYFWEDFTGGSIAATADAIVNGTSNVTIQTNSNIIVGVTGTTRATFAEDALYMAGNIIPTANNVYSLGSPTRQWASVYLSANTLYLGTTPLSANATSNTLTIGNSTVVTADPTGTSSTTGNMQVVGNVTGSNLFTGGVLSATGNVRGGNINTTGNVYAGNVVVGNIVVAADTISSANATIYIDPAADGGGTGLVVINGNLQVTGNTTTINSNTVSINDLVFNVANNASSGSQANGGGIGVGPVGAEYATLLYNDAGNVWTSNLGISSAGNVTGGNIAGTNLTGSLTTAAQANITSVGTLTSVSVTGNVTAGNVTTGIVSATGNIVGNNLSITNTLTAGGSLVTHAVLETATITGSAPASTTNFDILSQAVQYYTANASANVTLNFRGSSSVTANAMLSVGQSTTVALLWTNGSTAYYPNVIQIDSSNVTPKWQGGLAPTGGNANSVDIYAFTIVKTGSGTYAVFGSQTKFA